MVKSKLSKNDVAWLQIFDKLKIDDKVNMDGFYKIKASQIKSITGREPRLMTKFDHKSTRPIPFRKSNLSILPDTRGTYVIGKFTAYADVDYTPLHPIKKELPEHLESFDITNITSESIALNIAHASGMIDDVIGSSEYVKSILTLSGRMSSSSFNYQIKVGSGKNKSKHLLEVTKSQLEIDGSYENLDKIALIEAKNRVPEDFLVRQLYYPYRLYNNINTSKEIVPIFFTFADDIFSFHIYEFTDLMEYSSIKKSNQIDFVLNETLNITMQEIQHISKNVEYIKETMTVPQANDFIRVMDMLNYLEKPRTKEETAENYKFNQRQSDYYFNALKYLGFAERKNGKYTLTKSGQETQKLRNSKKRNLYVIRKILEHKPFNLILKHYDSTGGHVDLDVIINIFLQYGVEINEITAKRRAQSAVGWIDWIYSNVE